MTRGALDELMLVMCKGPHLPDAVVVVVSEETGSISYTYGGHIYRHLDGTALRNVLMTFLKRQPQGLANILKWRPMK